jgi:hypothetical protein
VDNSTIEPTVTVLNEAPVPKNKGGRPKGSVKPKNTKKALGRPKELGTKVAELKERLLNSADSTKLVNKVIAKALNDEDKDQMVALKLCLDRILPVSLFEKAKDSRSAIQINITGLTDVVIDESSNDEIEDAVIVNTDET